MALLLWRYSSVPSVPMIVQWVRVVVRGGRRERQRGVRVLDEPDLWSGTSRFLNVLMAPMAITRFAIFTCALSSTLAHRHP